MDRAYTLPSTVFDRRAVLKTAGASLAAITALGQFRYAVAQEGTPAPPVDEVLPFGTDTFAFVSGGYVSLFIVTSEGAIVVDPASQFDESRADRLKAAIAAATDQPVKYVIYSHDHADHAIGGAVFADTATFISHRNAVAKIEALNDPRTPVPTIAFDDYMLLVLGETEIELYYLGPNHSDNSLVVLHPGNSLLFAVDFIPVNSVLFQSLPDFYPDGAIASLLWIEENLEFETLIPGHPPVPGTKENVGQVRGYIVDLIAAVQAAQAEGLADNSPEMIDFVRAALEPDYGAWNNFDEWMPMNVEGLLRIWSEQAGTPTA